MYNLRTSPMPELRRLMVFIDGENIVLRYEQMLADGLRPLDGLFHQPAVYIWNQNTWMPPLHVVLRATYYTYVQGDELTVNNVHERLRECPFRQYRVLNQDLMAGVTDTLYSKVYKKLKGKKGKGVDIQMTVDILTNAYQNNMDTVYLLSGDGDYKPVIEECMRLGKQVCVGAFSSGLNEDLKLTADRFVCLDNYYFVET